MALRERVGISEYRVAHGPVVLVSYGLGSCLGIAIHDRERKLGGLAHTLLPMSHPELVGRPGKFVDASIRMMVEELLRQGAKPERLVAKVAGGANMFAAVGLGADGGIGLRNVTAARQVLAELGIPLLAEDVGGSCGRTIEFNLENGTLLVTTVRNQEQRLL